MWLCTNTNRWLWLLNPPRYSSTDSSTAKRASTRTMCDLGHTDHAKPHSSRRSELRFVFLFTLVLWSQNMRCDLYRKICIEATSSDYEEDLRRSDPKDKSNTGFDPISDSRRKRFLLREEQTTNETGCFLPVGFRSYFFPTLLLITAVWTNQSWLLGLGNVTT